MKLGWRESGCKFAFSFLKTQICSLIHANPASQIPSLVTTSICFWGFCRHWLHMRLMDLTLGRWSTLDGCPAHGEMSNGKTCVGDRKFRASAKRGRGRRIAEFEFFTSPIYLCPFMLFLRWRGDGIEAVRTLGKLLKRKNFKGSGIISHGERDRQWVDPKEGRSVSASCSFL